MVKIFWLWLEKGLTSILNEQNTEMEAQNRGIFSTNRIVRQCSAL